MRLPQQHRNFLDNSSGGSFTNRTQKEAAELLETISENTDAWDLDKGNKPGLDYEYWCVENFSTSILFEELKNRFGIDKWFNVFVNPLKNSTYVSKVVKHVHQVSSPIIEEIIEVPPYPSRLNKFKSNIKFRPLKNWMNKYLVMFIYVKILPR